MIDCGLILKFGNWVIFLYIVVNFEYEYLCLKVCLNFFNILKFMRIFGFFEFCVLYIKMGEKKNWMFLKVWL